jgi:hypothetical protein
MCRDQWPAASLDKLRHVDERGAPPRSAQGSPSCPTRSLAAGHVPRPPIAGNGMHGSENHFDEPPVGLFHVGQMRRHVRPYGIAP